MQATILIAIISAGLPLPRRIEIHGRNLLQVRAFCTRIIPTPPRTPLVYDKGVDTPPLPGLYAGFLSLVFLAMQQVWNIRIRAHHCAVSGRPFEEGERHFTAIYYDPATSGFSRRDVSVESWAAELAERKPYSHWRAVYEKSVANERPEVVPKESALDLLQRLVEEGSPYTERARYILAIMLERKRQLAHTATKDDEEGNKILFYENKKTGEIFIIRDPELRLAELEGVQQEVATLLGFGGPAAEAAAAVGMEFTPDGKLQVKEEVLAQTQRDSTLGEPMMEAESALPALGEEVAEEERPATEDDDDQEDEEAEELEEDEEEDTDEEEWDDEEEELEEEEEEEEAEEEEEGKS